MQNQSHPTMISEKNNNNKKKKKKKTFKLAFNWRSHRFFHHRQVERSAKIQSAYVINRTPLYLIHN